MTASVASGNGTISGNTAMSVNGIATFSDLRVTGTGAFTITFSAVGLTPATSNGFDVTDVLASQLSIATQPSTSVSNGQALGRQPAVQLLDDAGNKVARSGVDITASAVDTDVTVGGTTTATTSSTRICNFERNVSPRGAAQREFRFLCVRRRQQRSRRRRRWYFYS